jgi:hypothetical protein
LLALEHFARQLRFTAQNYEVVKRYLAGLVGWSARNPALRTAEAYEIAHRAVLAALEARPPRRSLRRRGAAGAPTANAEAAE